MYILYNNYNTLLPICELHDFYILKFVHVYNFNKHILPVVFQDYKFCLNSDIHNYNTRYRGDFRISLVHTFFGARQISFKGLSVWNEL